MTEWEYIDTKGKIQGPFKDSEIKQWVSSGYFPTNTHVRIFSANKDDSFKPIQEFKEFKSLFENKKQITIKSNKESSKTNIIGDGSNIGSCPKSDEIHWLYIDNNEKIQGPFSNSLMSNWYKNGHFEPNIKIQKYHRPLVNNGSLNPKNLIKSNFVTLKEYKNCEFFEISKTDKSKINWFYLDDHEKEQGPFSSTTMLKWCFRGFIKPNLRIRSEISTKYLEIGKLDKPFGESNCNETFWTYIDSNGQERGPYLLSIMAMWYLKGLFPEETLCRSSFHPDFMTMKDAKTHFTKTQNETVEELNLSILDDPTAKEGDDQWFFIDLDNGKPQGPYCASAMRQWYENGYLPEYIMVRKNNESEFKPIYQRENCEFVNNSPKNIHKIPMPPIGNPNQNFFNDINVYNSFNEPFWLYIANNGEQKGPFSNKQMQEWWMSGYITSDVYVKQTNEPQNMFRPIASRQCEFTKIKNSINKQKLAAESLSKLSNTLDNIN